MNRYQTVVVGLGAVGSAAAFQLASRGNKVLGIDQFSPPHLLGSTHGDSRITRQAIGEGAAYTPLALRSHEIWRELELRTGKRLLNTTGCLIISNVLGKSTLHGRSNFLQQTLDSATTFGIDHELLTAPKIRRRYPQFNVTDNDQAYFEPGAGYLRPERCVDVQLTLAKEMGAQIKTNERVIEFFPDGDGVRIITDAGEYSSEKLIVSAGPWIGDFLNSEYRSLFKVYRQVMYWFDVADGALFQEDRFPVFIWDLGSGDDMYGFPAIDGSLGGVKISPELYTEPTTPKDVDRTVSDAETAEMFRRRIKGRLFGVKDRCLRAVTCLYTVTPDSEFIIDTLPGMQQIIVASPCSGHGFKHSAAVGEALAEMATAGKSTLDISSFTIERFKGNVSRQ